MARLIDADYFIKKLAVAPLVQEAMRKAVDQMPTIDAVEVIRCENCRWFGEEDEYGQCWCHFNDVSTLKHSFCSHGERRKDE